MTEVMWRVLSTLTNLLRYPEHNLVDPDHPACIPEMLEGLQRGWRGTSASFGHGDRFLFAFGMGTRPDDHWPCQESPGRSMTVTRVLAQRTATGASVCVQPVQGWLSRRCCKVDKRPAGPWCPLALLLNYIRLMEKSGVQLWPI